MTSLEQAANDLAKKLIDKGELLEAGFAVFACYTIPKGASDAQRSEMQLAFMAGAEHVFSSIMGILEPGVEPTENELRRMELIHKEIKDWRTQLLARINPGQA